MNKAVWIACLLYRKGPMSKQDILNAWREENEQKLPMAQSTFYDNRRCLETRYGIHVRSENGLYYLASKEVTHHPAFIQLLASRKTDEASEKETTGLIWTELLLQAIRDKLYLTMNYSPFDKEAYETDFAPYCIKEIKNWCYVVGFSDKHHAIRTFALDRIKHLNLLPRHFKVAEGFREEEYFQFSFGAYGGMEVCPQNILIETNRRIASYLRQRPLHSSQKEIHTTKSGTCQFELCLAPSCDFIGELLAFAPEITILRPESLRKKIAEKLLSALNNYK